MDNAGIKNVSLIHGSFEADWNCITQAREGGPGFLWMGIIMKNPR